MRARLADRVWARAAKLQRRRPSVPPSPCQTPALSPSFVAALLAGLEATVTIVREIDRGGMSRVYATTDPRLVVKVSDVARGWSRHEPRAYEMLEGAGLPAARVAFAHFRQGYMVIGLEKLQCSFAAVLRTCALEDALAVDELARALKQLLAHLRAAAITFGDLSATNIMCRVPPGELCLIDPQFACPTEALARGMGREQATAFDTVHLALKIRALGLADASDAVRRAATVICCALLNAEHPPSAENTIQWLRKDAPMGLRLAFDAMGRRFAAAAEKKSDPHDTHAPEADDDDDMGLVACPYPRRRRRSAEEEDARPRRWSEDGRRRGSIDSRRPSRAEANNNNHEEERGGVRGLGARE